MRLQILCPTLDNWNRLRQALLRSLHSRHSVSDIHAYRSAEARHTVMRRNRESHLCGESLKDDRGTRHGDRTHFCFCYRIQQ